jgi:hypothetical protein
VLIGAAIERADWTRARRELDAGVLAEGDRTLLEARLELAQKHAAEALARLEKLAGERRVEHAALALAAEVTLARTDRALDRLAELEKDERADADVALVLKEQRPRLAELCASDAALENGRALSALEGLVADLSSERRPLLVRAITERVKDREDLVPAAARVLDKLHALDWHIVVGPAVGGLYELRSDQLLKTFRTDDAARAFERARRADPGRVAHHELLMALGSRCLGAVAAQDLDTWLEASLGQIRAGILDSLDTAGLPTEMHQRLWAALEAKQSSGGWAAEIAWAGATADEFHAANDSFRRCEAIAVRLAEDESVPIEARARARFVRAMLLWHMGRTDDAIAATHAALDFGYGKPDTCYQLLTTCACSRPEHRAEGLDFAREAARIADERVKVQAGTPQPDRPVGLPLIHSTERERTSSREALVDALIANDRCEEAEAIADQIDNAERQADVIDQGGKYYEGLRIRSKIHFARGLEDAEKLAGEYIAARKLEGGHPLSQMSSFFRRIGNGTIAEQVDSAEARLMGKR